MVGSRTNPYQFGLIPPGDEDCLYVIMHPTAMITPPGKPLQDTTDFWWIFQKMKEKDGKSGKPIYTVPPDGLQIKSRMLGIMALPTKEEAVMHILSSDPYANIFEYTVDKGWSPPTTLPANAKELEKLYFLRKITVKGDFDGN